MLPLNTPQIDYDATKEAVEAYISNYKYLMDLLPLRNEPQMTQAFSFIPPATNKNLNALEQAAEENLKRQQLLKRRETLLDTFNTAVQSLSPAERYIVVEDLVNYKKRKVIDIQMDSNMSKTSYYKIKEEAIKKFAFRVGIEVYRD